MTSNQPDDPVKINNDSPSETPNGSGVAAILSAGVGCFLLGLFGLLSDAFPPLAHFFNFYKPAGPLSGVTTSAVVFWLIIWAKLHYSWRGKDMCWFGKITAIAILLLMIGLLLSFPPFSDALQGK